MIPREAKCRWCGKRIYWIRTERGPMPIEAAWTPFKRRTDGAAAPALYTNEGVRIPCVILPESRAGEADGFAHVYHFCAKKPVWHRPRPLTRREKFQEQFE